MHNCIFSYRQNQAYLKPSVKPKPCRLNKCMMNSWQSSKWALPQSLALQFDLRSRPSKLRKRLWFGKFLDNLHSWVLHPSPCSNRSRKKQCMVRRSQPVSCGVQLARRVSSAAVYLGDLHRSAKLTSAPGRFKRRKKTRAWAQKSQRSSHSKAPKFWTTQPPPRP